LRITRLHIENFRNHKETEIDLDRINFFAGHNNAGKSSILAALEWGLTGRCLWTDKAGRGASDLVRQGEKKATVAMELEGLGTVVRSLPPHTLQVGRSSGVNEGQASLHNHLGADESRLQVALNANAFLTMSQAEQRSFLFSAYGLSWTAEQVVEELLRWLSKAGFKVEEAQRLAAKVKRYYPDGITSGPEIFEAMEKRAKEERKELKKDKQQAEAALAEISATSVNPEVPEGLDDAKSHLAELRTHRDELLKACGASREAQSRRKILLEKIAPAEERFAETQAKSERLALEFKGLRGPVNLEAEAETGDVENALQNEIDTANKALATARSKLESINKAGQALSSGDRCCPLAPDYLRCDLTQDQLDAVLSSLRQDFKLTSQELESQEAALKDATKKLAALRSSLEESRSRTKSVFSLQSEINTQSHLAETLEASLSDMKTELQSLPEDDQILLEDLAQLEVSIHQIETALAQYNEVQALASHRVALKQDVETLSAAVADQEILVRALAPDGMRKDLLSGILEGFVKRVNDRLGRLTEGTYHIHLAPAPEMTLLCCVNGGPFLPLKLLSKSEQLRVGIAINETLSSAVGLKFLAIDEADMLDQENRDLLAGMLLDLAEEFDQVLVFTTVGDIPPQNPNLPGVKMFWVEDGSVHEL